MIRMWWLQMACGIVAMVMCGVAMAVEPTVLPLWPDGAPGSLGKGEADVPTLTVSLPPKDKNTGTAIVICPGGGYGGLAMDHEGKQVAEWCNSLGIAGCILRYRHSPYRHPIPLGDAQRAIRTVRYKAKEWNIKPDQIGIIGFSAGGHLASTTGTHFDAGDADAKDPIDRVSCRPDFMILCYPVISFTKNYTHQGSRKNLLGIDPDPKLVENLSNEKQVTKKTPPTFLFHTNADNGVLPDNSVAFYMALRAAKVPAEMHIYERGPHGVGLAPKDNALKTWPDLCARWMKIHGWLPAMQSANLSAASQASVDTISPPAAELVLRILAEQNSMQEDSIQPMNGVTHANLSQYIRDLDEHGAPAPRGNVAWFEDAMTSKSVQGITSTHEGKRYVLAYTSETEVISNRLGILNAAMMSRDTSGRMSIALTFNSVGAQAMRQLTLGHLGKTMGLFLDGRLMSSAVIQSEIRDRAQISGNFTPKQIEEIIGKLASAIPSSRP